MSVETQIRDRLMAIDPPVFRMVGLAGDFSLVGDASPPKAMPAAYVLVEEEVSAPNARATGPVLQETAIDVAVVIVTRNLSDATGGAASQDIGSLKQAVRRALVGFVPDAETGAPIEHIQGSLLKAKAGIVWQRELFGVQTYTSEE